MDAAGVLQPGTWQTEPYIVFWRNPLSWRQEGMGVVIFLVHLPTPVLETGMLWRHVPASHCKIWSLFSFIHQVFTAPAA